ncbi:MAG: GumC family protein, partial [Cucumibacter sp.]
MFTSDDALIAELRDRIVVARERDSRVISIAFRAEDPGLAARVANALARAHVQRRADLLLEDTSDATVWLQREIEDLRGRVSEAESKVANYRVDHDLFDGSGDTSLLQQQMSDATAQISAASERRNMVETQARLIRGLLDAGQPVETIAEVRASPVIQQLAEQKASLQAQRAERAATLLASHPAVRALDAQIAELTAEIQAEGRRIAQAFDSQAALEAEHGQSLRDGLARLKIQASSAEIDGVTLAELDREAAAERDLLNAFLIRYREAAARTNSDAALPDVRIVSTAAEPDLPVYPQKSLLVAAVAMVTIVLLVGAILLGELAGGTVFVPRQNRAD